MSKKDGSMLPCVDYKVLIAMTVPDGFSTKAIDLIQSNGKANAITTLDSLKDYWAIVGEKSKEAQDVGVTHDDSDSDKEEFMTNEIQETNEVEATSVMKGRTSLKDVLYLKDCPEKLVNMSFSVMRENSSLEKTISLTESGVNISSMQRTLKS
ncbi:hypothetical protein AVEN_8014-1 [Araneus ventricosus]|uniref:Uncharacterized protein n=1 Tax=Araneus ventricosus TaxID=182803 RepID=A0A4Y2L0U4_ARAVE|nr:hypothetical protein AVEN_8014-1 [Araneus ventricosus]